MTQKAGPNASLTTGIILLAVSCVNIGYGLCMSVNGMDNSLMPLGIGVMLSGLSTVFITKSAKMLRHQAASGSHDTQG
jgi:predicted phage tail protein